MSKATHWKRAAPIYLKISTGYSLQFTLPILAAILVRTLWIRLTRARWIINLVGFKLALIFGGIFFCLALLTAIGSDLHRNWGSDSPTASWNPALFWKTFLYLGAVFFLFCAFFSYHQGAWLSIVFGGFAAGSAVTANKCL